MKSERVGRSGVGEAVVCEVQLKISELSFILNVIALDFEVSQAHIEVL